MLKRFNQYLVTNHPQLWNTRLPHMLLAILVIHVLFFIAGYLHFDDWGKLHTYYNINHQLVQSENIAYSILASTLLLIVWLVFYLRNNPFKSFYPLKPVYFFTEFAIIFIVIFGSITFYKSYASGFCYAIERQTNSINLVEEVNTYNLAYGLLPSKRHHYGIHNSCDSIGYIDSLRSLRAEYMNLYLDEEDGIVKNSYYKDTLDDSITQAITGFLQRQRDETDFRFTYFCYKQCSILDSFTYSKNEISALLQQWITTGNKQQVVATLARFEKMCAKYKIRRNVNVEEYSKYVFADKNYHPVEFINDGDVAYAKGVPQTRGAQIQFEQLNKALDNLEDLYYGDEDTAVFWLANFFAVLNMAIFLFTFRLTPIRVWFTAIAAHLALPILLGLIGVTMYEASHSEYAFLHFLLFLFATTYVMHFALREKMKKTAGVMLIWVTWWLLYVGVILYGILQHIYEPEQIRDATGNYTYVSNPMFDFLKDYGVQIAAVYMLFTFFYIAFVLTRHYRKWMALPEE